MIPVEAIATWTRLLPVVVQSSAFNASLQRIQRVLLAGSVARETLANAQVVVDERGGKFIPPISIANAVMTPPF